MNLRWVRAVLCLICSVQLVSAEPPDITEVVEIAQKVTIERVQAYLDGGSVGYALLDEKGQAFWILARNTFQYPKPRKVFLSPHPPSFNSPQSREVISGSSMEKKLLRLLEHSSATSRAGSLTERRSPRLIQVIRNREEKLPTPREIYDAGNRISAPRWEPPKNDSASQSGPINRSN